MCINIKQPLEQRTFFFNASPLWILLILTMTSMLLGCGESNLTGAEYVERAREYHDKGDFQSSVIELKNAVRVDPGNAEARWLLGGIYLEIENGASAEKELIRARELGLDSHALKSSLGEALLLQRKFLEVIEQIEPDIDAIPENFSEILRIRGEAELGLGNLPTACLLFTEAQDTAPNYGPVYLGLARCAVGSDDMDAALDQVEKAIELDPMYSKSWLLLGQIARVQGRDVAAGEAFTKAVELAPHSRSALLARATQAFAMNNLDIFRQDIKTFKKRHPGDILGNYLTALLDIKEGRVESARNNLQKVTNRLPGHLHSQVLLAGVNLDLGSPLVAENILTKVVTQAPGYTRARRLLVQSQLRIGRPKRALVSLQPLLTVENPQARDLAMSGDAYLRLGDINKAIEVFTLAHEDVPESAGAHINLAWAHLNAGEAEQALQNLAMARKIDPENTSADMLAVMSHLSVKDYDAALDAAQRLESESYHTAQVSYLEGRAHMGKEDLPAARLAFEQSLSIDPSYSVALLKLVDIDVLEGKPEAAQARLEEAVNNNASKDYRIMMVLAELSQRAGDQAQALAWVEKAAETDPQAIEPREVLIKNLIAEKKTLLALSMAKELVQYNPENPKALNLQGMAQMALEDHESALLTYQHLTDILPESSGSHYRLGLTLMGLGKYAEARESLTTAMQIAPDAYKIKATMGALENHVGNYTEAVRIARELQRTYPGYHTGYMLEGDTLMDQGKAPEAVPLYQKALDIVGTEAAVIRLAEAMEKSGRGEDAATVMADWLKSNPEHSQVRLELATYYQKSQQPKAAIALYEELVDQSPNNALLINNLAGLYWQVKDSRALRTAEKAYELKPNEPAILDTYGWILAQEGETKRGLEMLDKALSTIPDNTEVRYHHAAILVMAGENARAKRQLQDLLALGSIPQEREVKALLEKL